MSHCVEDNCAGDIIADPHDLAVEAGLYLVDVLFLPQPHRRQGSADVDQHRSREAARELLHDIRFRLADSPPHHLDILVDLLAGQFKLVLTVTCNFDPEVFDGFYASYPSDLLYILLREDLRLFLVEAEVPPLLQNRQLVDDHCQLILIVGHHQHVVGEGQ